MAVALAPKVAVGGVEMSDDDEEDVLEEELEEIEEEVEEECPTLFVVEAVRGGSVVLALTAFKA